MFDYLRTDDAMLDALCIVAMSRSIVFCIVCIDNTLAIQNSTPMISGAAIALGYRELVPESLAFGGLKQNGRVPLPLWRGQRQANLLFVFDLPKRALRAWVTAQS